MYEIKTTPNFDKDLKKLGKPVSKRIIEKVEQLAENPSLAVLMKFTPKDLEGLCKYRIGDWRVLCWIDHQKKEIVLYGVDNRGRVYRKLKGN